MEVNAIQIAIAAGTVLAGIGTCATAYYTFRAVRREEQRDIPAAVVGRAGDAGVCRNTTIVVSNVGHIPFTVVEVCVGGMPICHGGLEFIPESPRRGIRTVLPGDHALFEVPDGHPEGIATVRIANGLVFAEKRVP